MVAGVGLCAYCQNDAFVFNGTFVLNRLVKLARPH